MSKSTGRLDDLDGLRAVAILAVLGLHWVSWYVPLFHGGSIGVDVFFVLSAFIITTMLWRSRGPDPGSEPGAVRTAYLSFLRRRVLRLYPALIGLVVVTTALYAVVPPAGLSVGEVARRGGLALGQVSSVWAAMQTGTFWLPALHPFAHTWSLAVEWYFYLLWPLPVFAARRAGWTPRRLARVSLAAAAVLFVSSLWLSPHWFYFGPTARAAELLVGAALALQLIATPAPWAPRWPGLWSWLALGAIVGYVLVGPASRSAGYRFVGIPLGVTATVVLIRGGYTGTGGRVQRLLSHPWAALLGRHSYSLYLWHLPPFLLLEDVGGPKWVRALATVAIALALTALSYRFLERPFMRARSDVLRPTPSPQPQDTALGERRQDIVGGGPGPA